MSCKTPIMYLFICIVQTNTQINGYSMNKIHVTHVSNMGSLNSLYSFCICEPIILRTLRLGRKGTIQFNIIDRNVSLITTNRSFIIAS